MQFFVSPLINYVPNPQASYLFPATDPGIQAPGGGGGGGGIPATATKFTITYDPMANGVIVITLIPQG